MKKRFISIALALIMALSLLTISASAAVTLSLNKTTYGAGEAVIVTYSGITAEQKEARAWVAVAKSGAAAEDYLGYGNWEYVKEGTGQVELSAPKEGGDYEVRLYQEYNATEESFLASASVFFTSVEELVSYPTYETFDWSLLEFTPGKASWTGEYDTYYDRLSLVQAGDKVTGQYPEWDDGKVEGIVVDNVLYGWTEAPSRLVAERDAGQIVFVLHEDGNSFTGWWRYGYSGNWQKWSDGDRILPEEEPVGKDAPWSNASDWAVPELEKALSNGLIPPVLNDKDFTKPITRAEFAAVAVKLYENLTGKTTAVPSSNPFTDTSDPEVLKAYSVGIVGGMTATTFAPDTLISREQAAAMLTRVYKAATIDGWTLANDAKYPLAFTMPAPFADDAKISAYARESVYFMFTKNVIGGTGNNNFSPRATTTAEQAANFASATREQALAISVRVVEKLKGTTPEIAEPTTTAPTTPEEPTSPTTTTPEEPTTPTPTAPSGSGPEIKVSYTAAELATIRAGVEALIQDAPTGGKIITWQELQNILAQYQKSPGSGNTFYTKRMNGQFEKQGGKWQTVYNLTIGDYWNRDNVTFPISRTEMLYIVYPLPEKEGVVDCIINKEDAQFYYAWEWNKGASMGIYRKTPKTPTPGYDPGLIPEYDPSKIPDLKVTLFPDAKVDGQDCVVYSYEIQGMTMFMWFSKTKGFEILQEVTSPYMPTTTAIYTYENKKITTDDALYDSTKQGVSVWNEQ